MEAQFRGDRQAIERQSPRRNWHIQFKRQVIDAYEVCLKTVGNAGGRHGLELGRHLRNEMSRHIGHDHSTGCIGRRQVLGTMGRF